jgi:hypothetical protein
MSIKLIQTVVVGAGSPTYVDFTSIPQTGNDLILVHSARTGYAGSGDTLHLQFNGDTTAANYTYYRLIGNGTSASTASSNTYFFAGYASGSTDTANAFGNGAVYIPNYSATGIKTGSADSAYETNASLAISAIHADKWSGTAAITSIRVLAPSGAGLAQNTTLSLYSVTKGTLAGVTVA